jgi:C4-dicarboxylate transporter
MLLVFLLPLIVAVGVSAQAGNGAIAQGFAADTSKGDIVAGALVSFTSGNVKRVELATSESASRLAGVVDDNPFVAISDSKCK